MPSPPSHVAAAIARTQAYRRHTPGGAAGARLGAVVFIQRFQRSAYGSGALLNAHTHLHVIVLDGLCDPDGAGGVRFQGACGLDGEGVAELPQRIRTQLIPPPRTHRHRYFGCLAPNAPIRAPIALWAQACGALAQEQALADEHQFTPLPPVGAA